MIEKNLAKGVIENIVSDPLFNNSKLYKELLMYLFECSIDGKIPTETDIAAKVYKREKNFDPSSDTLVRVNIYKLRRKLDEYYKTSGKNDRVKVQISKGHYQVVFLQPSQQRRKFRYHFGVKDWIYIAVILVILSSGILYFKSINTKCPKSQIDKNDLIWSTFFGNQLPATVVIGDQFSYFEFDKEWQRERLLTDWHIANDDQFNNLVLQNPTRNLRKQDHGTLPDNSIFNLHEIERVFYSFNQNPEIKLSSQIAANDYDVTKLADQNIIYMGGFKNLLKLHDVLNKIPVEITYTDLWKGELKVTDKNTNSVKTFASRELIKNEYFLDYGLIAKIPGNKNENFMLINGFAYPSQIEIVKMLSRPDLLAEVYKTAKQKQREFPEFFFMIVEYKASHFSAMEHKIVYFSEL